MKPFLRSPRQGAVADGESRLLEDVHTGIRTYVVGSRQARPNLPEAGCPFCPGGLEAPELYDVRWFPNRGPAMPDERCGVILYADHDATFWSLGPAEHAGWSGSLGRAHRGPGAADIDYVLVFENRAGRRYDRTSARADHA